MLRTFRELPAIVLLFVIAASIYLVMTIPGCERPAIANDNGTHPRWIEHTDGNLYLFVADQQTGVWNVKNRYFRSYNGGKALPWGDREDCPPIPFPEPRRKAPPANPMPRP